MWRERTNREVKNLCTYKIRAQRKCWLRYVYGVHTYTLQKGVDRERVTGQQEEYRAEIDRRCKKDIRLPRVQG